MTLLRVEGLRAGYGSAEVLHGVDLAVDEGELVVVLGANGAGKSTTLRALSGVIRRRGLVEFDGRDLTDLSPDQIVAVGMSLVPEGRGTFTKLTVEENLLVGAARRSDRRAILKEMDHYFEIFPVLGSRRRQEAGTLSGGEQQMLAVARALMSRPRLLLCDEPSLGLAPIVVQDLFRVLRQLNVDSGTAMLLVEQNAEMALGLAARGYVLEAGMVVASGPAEELQASDEIRHAYLGG